MSDYLGSFPENGVLRQNALVIISTYCFRISYETTELKLVGLKNFSVASLDASEASLKASGTITIPVLTLSAGK